ncbi:hypothetical protein ACLOJK_007454 [Asimina triloba]
MYLQGTVLHWFPLNEEFFYWCEASAHLIAAVLVPSLPKAERKFGKKVRLRKKTCSSTKGESVKERGTDLLAVTTPRMAFATASEAPTEPTHEGMIGPTSTSPLEGFFIGIEGGSLAEPDPSSEGFSGLPPLEGTLQVIGLEEEGDVSLLCEQVALLKSREVKLFSECEAAQLKAVRFREELEASCAEVMCLQASLREGNVWSLVVIEYPCNDIHWRREEFELSHYSQSKYVRALSDVATLHPSIDLSSLYQIP